MSFKNIDVLNRMRPGMPVATGMHDKAGPSNENLPPVSVNGSTAVETFTQSGSEVASSASRSFVAKSYT